MTIQEMHIRIELGLNKLGSTVYDGFDPEELDIFIDKVVQRKINSILSIERDDLRLGFQGDQKRLDDIRTLVSTDYTNYLLGQLDPNAGYVTIPLPENYRNLVNLRVIYLDTDCDEVSNDCLLQEVREDGSGGSEPFKRKTGCVYHEVPARVIRQNQVYETLRNPFSKSTKESPVATISGNLLQVFQGKGFIVSGTIADYIRTPENVSLISGVDCELAAHTHDEIVDEVVNHILEVTGNPRFQSSNQDIQRSE